MVSGAIEAAEGSATTDWATYDGPVPSKFMFHAIFFPVAMGAFLIVPGIICFFALGFGRRGRIVQYQPPYPARFGESPPSHTTLTPSTSRSHSSGRLWAGLILPMVANVLAVIEIKDMHPGSVHNGQVADV